MAGIHKLFEAWQSVPLDCSTATASQCRASSGCQARGDLQHARSDVEGAFYDWACFPAQQAAEKAVKALLQRMGAVAWGHSVADLLAELAQRQEVPEDIRDAALELDKAYIPSRYPDAHPSGSPRRRYIRVEAERLVEYAAKIVRFCEGLLSTLEP